MEINNIYNENCLDTMKRMDDNFIDLTVTSPPYDNLRAYNGYSFDFESIAKELYRVTKEGGVVVWIVGDSKRKGSRTLTHFKQSLFFKEIGFNIHDIMIWKKNNVMPYILKNCYTPSYEIMIVLSKGKPKTTNIIREKCKHAGKVLTSTTNNVQSMRKGKKIVVKTKPTKPKHNVWTTMTTGKNYGHPAIFPENLVEKCLKVSGIKKGKILDPFMGTGTTGLVAKKYKLNFIGIELDKDYFKHAKNRIESAFI